MGDGPAHIALALYFCWLVLALGLRVLVHYRETGKSGLHGPARDASAAEWWAGALLVFSIFTGVAAPLLEETGQVSALYDSPLIRWSGAGIAFVGVLLTYFAQIAMGRSWRVGVDREQRTDLVTTGPFDLVRNPIFTAMIVTMLGLTLLVANVAAFAAFFGLVIAIEIQVRAVEEPHLRRVHGRQYLRYTEAVGRFYPGIGKAKSR